MTDTYHHDRELLRGLVGELLQARRDAAQAVETMETLYRREDEDEDRANRMYRHAAREYTLALAHYANVRAAIDRAAALPEFPKASEALRVFYRGTYGD